MPFFGGFMLLAQILCAVHVARTGRPYFWIYIVVFVPMVGMAAYFLVEILPELTGSRPARQAAQGLMRTLDPGRRVREAMRQVQITPTTQNKALLAAAYLEAGQASDAVALYHDILVGIHATDPALMQGLARALFAARDYAGAQSVLEVLRQANPDHPSPEGHLLYARCLEEQGRVDAARFEYGALAAYYPGQEARCRHAVLLARAGRAAEAHELFAEICQAIELGPHHQRRAQREWYDIAKRGLAGAAV
jgi:hypothetical protein